MRNNIKNLQIKLCYPVEEIFNNIVGNITDIKTDDINRPHAIYYFSGGEYVAEYNQRIKYFFCENNTFWLKFKLNSSFDFIIISNLLNPMIEEYFKLSDVTTLLASTHNLLIEEYFK